MTDRDEARTPTSPEGVFLLWIPLGAGGVGYVRFNGRAYEWVKARLKHRPARDLYHTALEVHLPEGRFVIENAWPSPDGYVDSRGVVLEGPVFSLTLARFRAFRYEVRRWRDGVIPDIGFVAKTFHVTNDSDRSRRLLDLVTTLPPAVWGRDEADVGEMWNSNSVISWLLTTAGFDAESMTPPPNGAAPGWRSGIVIARSRETTVTR